ncbi:MAG: NAD(+)/NADH kinase [Thermoleophilia bacterium]|nr:NAD(+)/NADH kinase [Thermoleophilia bacterium]
MKALLATHGRRDRIGDGIERLLAVAAREGVEIVIDEAEAERHGIAPQGDPNHADLAVALGGDGTMLRALASQLGKGVPVVGVNFGSVGFLTAIARDDLEVGLSRVFRGELVTVELPTLELSTDDGMYVAVNDVVIASAETGRMVVLDWAVGGEELGRIECDGLICSTPSGSTAYNLSNGGPVLMWGIDALALTFVAPHSLHARPLVVPRGLEVVAWNRTPDISLAVLVDGHRIGDAAPGERVRIRLGAHCSLLGTLPNATFFSRFRRVFAT